MPNPSPQTASEDPYPQNGYTSRASKAATESYQKGYQQALTDFAISGLLQTLTTFSDLNFDAQSAKVEIQEVEAIVALLIQALTASLDGELLLRCLEALRYSQLDLSTSLANLRLPPPLTALPLNFPEVELPRFLYGDRLQWISNGETTDWGIAIGRFYSFAPHRGRWQWCYLILLDDTSPSSSWSKADIAWEDDLEPLETEVLL